MICPEGAIVSLFAVFWNVVVDSTVELSRLYFELCLVLCLEVF